MPRARRASRAKRRNTQGPEVEKTPEETVVRHRNGTVIRYIKGDPKPRIRKSGR